jgi:hypothetical protein
MVHGITNLKKNIYIYTHTHVLTGQSLLVSIRTRGSNTWSLSSAHTVLSVCLFMILNGTSIVALYDRHRIIFLRETNFVCSDVRTESVYVCSLMLSFIR